MRDMAAAAASELAHMRDARLRSDADAAAQNAAIADILERALAEGEQSLKRGPELLPILKASGVVDAGGYGVIVIFAGVIAALRGTGAPELDHHAPARISHPHHASETFRYCTNFAVTRQAAGAAPASARRSRRSGDSVLVVGDHHTLKVHVHTDDPEAAMAVFAEAGEVSHLDVADMHAQVQERIRVGAGLADDRAGRRPVGRARAVRGAGRGRRRGHARAVPLARRPRPRRRRRRSTRRRPSCWPASTTCPPTRSSSCPTART